MMSHPVRIGVKVLQHIAPIEEQREAWRIADEGGLDAVWAFDHLYTTGSDPAQPIFDGWTILGAMAEATTRVRIGLIVTGNLYRHPALLTKIAVTVDHLSRGRLEFGIGAGWNEPEFKGLGIPFPESAADRIRMLEEACVVYKLLTTEPRPSFRGRYYTLTDAIAEPKPVQKPYPPIWIGGSGLRRTLRVVAKHADAWNTNADSLEEAIAASRVLDEHCAAVGRDPQAVRRSVQFPYTTPEQTLEVMRRYREAGFSDFMLQLGRRPDIRPVAEAIVRDLLPRARQLR